MVKRKNIMGLERNHILMIGTILLIAFVLTRPGLFGQAQYIIKNTIDVTTYAYSDNGILNSGSNKADTFVTVECVVADKSQVSSVMGALYNELDNSIIISKLLTSIPNTLKYNALFDISGLDDQKIYYAKSIVTTTVETDVKYSANYNIWIDHPNVPIEYVFNVWNGAIQIEQYGTVSDTITLNFAITTGAISGIYLHLYKGADSYVNKIDTMLSLDAINSYTLDTNTLENGDYRFEGAYVGAINWNGGSISFYFTVENVPTYDAVTGSTYVWQINADGTKTLVSDPAELHDTILIGFEVATGQINSIKITVYQRTFDTYGVVTGEVYVSETALIFSDTDNKWITSFNTRILPNGVYRFEFSSIRQGDGLLTTQSAFDWFGNSGDDGSTNRNYLVWIGAGAAIIGIIAIIMFKQRM